MTALAQAPARGGAAHIREHRSLLAAAEKRALVWIAARLPRRVTSDQLTLLGLTAMAGAAAACAALPLTPYAAIAAVACLAVNWFGDSLDGTLARVRGQQRPRFGYYVDHVIDLAGTTLLLTGLAWSDSMTPGIAAALLAAYLLVSAEVYLATHAAGIFRMSFLGVGPTELRLLLAAGILKISSTPWIEMPWLGEVKLFDVGGVIAAVGLAATFIVSAVRTTRLLYAAEPLPAAASPRRAA
jgi:phosphatidylglycerophosphate synthase